MSTQVEREDNIDRRVGQRLRERHPDIYARLARELTDVDDQYELPGEVARAERDFDTRDEGRNSSVPVSDSRNHLTDL